MAGEYRSLKKQHYLNLIKECASSGKNKQQWCSENGIKYGTPTQMFYYIYIGLIMLIIACISQINKSDFIIFQTKKNSHNRRS